MRWLFFCREVSFVTGSFCAGRVVLAGAGTAEALPEQASWGRGCSQAVAAFAGTQLTMLSASTPFPSAPFLPDEFHQPFLSSCNVSLCFTLEEWLYALPASFPCLPGRDTTTCLPAWRSGTKLVEGQKHCHSGRPSCNSYSFLLVYGDISLSKCGLI